MTIWSEPQILPRDYYGEQFVTYKLFIYAVFIRSKGRNSQQKKTVCRDGKAVF